MYLLSSIPHAVTLVGPPFANVFMRVSLWLPFEVTCGFHGLAILIVWCMPESLKHQQAAAKLLAIVPPEAIPEIINEIESHHSVAEHAETAPFLLQDHSALLPTSNQADKGDSYKTLREILHPFSIPTFPFIFLLFLKSIALISKAFTYQFPSESFGCSIAQKTWLRRQLNPRHYAPSPFALLSLNPSWLPTAQSRPRSHTDQPTHGHRGIWPAVANPRLLDAYPRSICMRPFRRTGASSSGPCYFAHLG